MGGASRLTAAPPCHQGLLYLGQGIHSDGVRIWGKSGVSDAIVECVVSQEAGIVVILPYKIFS